MSPPSTAVRHLPPPDNTLNEIESYDLRQAGETVVLPSQHTIIDLFSGAGGLTLGFTENFNHSFLPIWANDFNEQAAASYNLNFGGHCHLGDISGFLDDYLLPIPKADVVIGGPPCQGFSLLNKKRAGDPRKQLWRPFFEVVKRADADVFVMENVIQLLGSPEYGQIVEEAARLGFQVASAKLCAADYGVAQTRWRAFIVGCRFMDPSSTFPPKRTHYNPIKGVAADEANYLHIRPQPWKTLKDVISDLAEPEGTAIREDAPPYDLHFGRNPTELSKKRYRTIPEEGMNRFDLQAKAPELTPACWIRKKTGGTDLFGRLWWDRPAFTIRTEFFKPEKGRYLHPTQHRPITHREAARIQSFPDDFLFSGSKIEIAKQIGNAVPPLLSARIADCVVAMFSQRPA